MIAFLLTTLRLFLAAAFAACVYFFSANELLTTVEAATLVVLIGVEEATDALDGWAARRFGTASRLGGLYDPLSDSLARLTCYFAIALAGWVTVAVPLVMTARDIIVSYTRVVNAYTGGKTSARISGKLKAVIQGGALPILVGLIALRGVLDPAIVGWGRSIVAAGVIAITLWSLLDYLRGALPGAVRMYRRKPADPGRADAEKPDEASP